MSSGIPNNNTNVPDDTFPVSLDDTDDTFPVSSVNGASSLQPSSPLSETNTTCGYNAVSDRNVERFQVNGKWRWKCVFCTTTFAWNATKALKHFAGVSNGDIKLCGAIPAKHKIEYAKIYSAKEKATKQQNEQSSRMKEIMEEDNNEVAAMYESRAKRLKSSETTSESVPKTYHQLKVTDVDPELESQLSAAIAAFIHCCGLPFSIASHPQFLKVLTLARRVGTKYTPPCRKLIAGLLLDLTYEHMQNKQKEELLKDVGIFGLSLYGDGATIHKMPLLNLLASGVHQNVAVLDIVDATAHIEEGGKKDAEYIASLFQPHIEKFENASPNSVDYLSFDGAGNVQLAAGILAAKYPRIIITHGAEHVISLFFQDCFKLPLLNTLHKLERNIYAIFGSGARHGPYAVFQKNCRTLYGKVIGMFKPSGTRMAGNAIALMRAYRLKDAIIATVHSPEFQTSNVSTGIFIVFYILYTIVMAYRLTFTLFLSSLQIRDSILEVITNNEFWDHVAAITTAFMPTLFLLRLADRNIPAMDQLYYYVRKMDGTINKTKDVVDGIERVMKDRCGYTSTGTLTSKEIEKFYLPSNNAAIRTRVSLLSTVTIPVTMADDDEDDTDNEGGADEGEIPDDLSMDGEDDGDVLTQGQQIKLYWDKRSKHLRHDIAIVAWMCSPIPDVMDDAKLYGASELMAVERVLMKWIISPNTCALVGQDKINYEANIINTFWQEHKDFQSKSGAFQGRENVSWHFNHPDLKGGTSYFWHEKVSCKLTKVFGKLAARASSKILGIGSAERAWGDVKQLKSGKRSHLSADKVKKQATLFGESAMRIARSKRKASIDDPKSKYALADSWYDEDLDAVLKLLNPIPVEKPRAPVRTRYFHAHISTDDIVKISIRDTKVMHSLLQKWGDLHWNDGETTFRSGKEKMMWHRTTKSHKGGWYLRAYDDECYQPTLTYDENREAGGVEEVPITLELVDSIAEYHSKHPELGVVVVRHDAPPESNNVDVDGGNATTLITANNNSTPN